VWSADAVRNGVPVVRNHRARPPVTRHTPVHVTLKLLPQVYSLRTPRCFRALERAMRAGSERFGMRLVHHSVQRDHLHLLIEADDKRALSRGMQGLKVRMARALNRVLQRKGKVFRERYHQRILRSPLETKRALGYVLLNTYKHMSRFGAAPWSHIDRCSSGPWFDGWTRPPTRPPPGPPCTVAARSWMLREGWKRHGLLDPSERPRTNA
jgi:REP element-mobilizing transposase RayT